MKIPIWSEWKDFNETYKSTNQIKFIEFNIKRSPLGLIGRAELLIGLHSFHILPKEKRDQEWGVRADWWDGLVYDISLGPILKYCYFPHANTLSEYILDCLTIIAGTSIDEEYVLTDYVPQGKLDSLAIKARIFVKELDKQIQNKIAVDYLDRI